MEGKRDFEKWRQFEDKRRHDHDRPIDQSLKNRNCQTQAATHSESAKMSLSVLELCAGGGGQALGLEAAGFDHAGVVEMEGQYCNTLRRNRPHWNVLQMDLRNLSANALTGVDLIAAGVPCPPFSIAGLQLGADDDRDMFPSALELVRQIAPRAVLFENVPGLASAKFEKYRSYLMASLRKMGYQPDWQVVNASDFGVPQLRPRFVLVALRPIDAEHFCWPTGKVSPNSVGTTLVDLMGENGWKKAEEWARHANHIAPPLVGGSKKHGGPDLGPTRAKAQWRSLGVDGMGIADSAPEPAFPEGKAPRLTIRMVARIQSFPDQWEFTGGKTAAYRQIGNAFPPPVAQVVGSSIASALDRKKPPVDYPIREPAQMRLLERAKSTPHRALVKRHPRKLGN